MWLATTNKWTRIFFSSCNHSLNQHKFHWEIKNLKTHFFPERTQYLSVTEVPHKQNHYNAVWWAQWKRALEARKDARRESLSGLSLEDMDVQESARKEVGRTLAKSLVTERSWCELAGKAWGQTQGQHLEGEEEASMQPTGAGKVAANEEHICCAEEHGTLVLSSWSEKRRALVSFVPKICTGFWLWYFELKTGNKIPTKLLLNMQLCYPASINIGK